MTNAINSLREEAKQLAAAAEQTAKEYADAAADAAEKAAIAAAEDLADEAYENAVREAQEAADKALELAKEYADQVALAEAQKAKAEVLAEIQDDLRQTLEDAKAYTDEELRELKDELMLEITQLSSRIEGVVTEFNNKIGDLENEFNDKLDSLGASLGGEIDGLRDSVYADLAGLHQQVYEILTDLNLLKSTVEEQGQQINDLIAFDALLDTRLKALEGYKATIEDFIASTTEELNEINKTLLLLDGRLSNLESENAEQAEAIKNLQKALEQTRSEITEQIEKLQGQIDAINNSILTIQGLIAEINKEIALLYGEIAGLESDITSVSNSLEAYKVEVDNMLEIIQSELEAAIANGDQAVKEELIAKLNEAIASLNESLRDYFTTELAELETLFGQQISEVWKELSRNYAELSGKIADIEQRIADLQKAILEYINESLVVLREEITEQFSDLLSDLEGKIGNRLTSISLIPETYVNGVPSIMIPVMQYNEWIAGNVAEVYTKDIQNTYYSAIDTVIVRYHLSPDHIDMNGIDGISYLFESAEIVKGYMDDPQWFTIDENKARINDRNELEVPLKRDYVAIGQGERYDLHTTDATEIVTAALKVGIAEELFMEGETDACVTSEYSAIYDDVFGIHITPLFDLAQDIDGFACVNGNHKKFSTTFAAAQGAEVSQQVLYNGQLDLLSMVTSCIARQTGNGVKEISKESLRDYGYAFRFELPAEFHKGTEETNEQDFIYFVDNNKTVVASKLPDGTQNNKAAVGRTPIVRAMLMDTVNNHIIDVQWFKLEWVNEIMPAEEIDLGTIKEFDYLLNCNDFEGQVTWQEFNNLVIGKIGESGITHEDFGYYYVNNNSLSYEIELDETAENFNNAIGTITINWPAAEVPQTTTILKWHLTVAEIGNVIDELLADEDGMISKTVIVTVNPQPDRVAPILKFRFKVNVSVEDLPEIFGYNNPRWEDAGHTSAKINPIAFKDASPESGDYDFPECVYYADIFDLFTSDENGNIVTNLYMSEDQIAKYEASNAFDCRRWDMQFSAVQANAPEGYTYVPEFAYNDPTALYAPDESEEGYGLITTAGLDFPWITMTQQWTQHGQDNWYRTEAGEIIEAYFIQTAIGTPYDESLIALANDEDASVAIDIWARINQFNVVKVKTFDISFVNPLTIAAPKTNASITDEYNVTQTVALDSYLGQVTDFAGERVDNDEDAAEYYGLEYTWGDLSTVRINMRYDGNDIIVDSSLDPADPEDYAKMLTLEEAKLNYATLEEDGGKTTFTYTRTNAQLSLKEPAVIYIPVSYTHFWGEAQFYLPIQVKVGKL